MLGRRLTTLLTSVPNVPRDAVFRLDKVHPGERRIALCRSALRPHPTSRRNVPRGLALVRVDLRRAIVLKRALSMAGIAQLVERQVVVLDVTGSSPVARPISGRVQ
jgi:hypothetical protein